MWIVKMSLQKRVYWGQMNYSRTTRNTFFGALLAPLLMGCSDHPNFPRTRSEKEAALQAARNSTIQAPSAENYDAFGLAQSSLGLHDAAVSAYMRALELDPRLFAAHNHLCTELNVLGNWNAAMTHCEQATLLKPESTNARNGFRFARKMQALNGITNAAGLINSGLELYNKGNWNEAVRIWLQISPESQHFAAAQSNLACAYILLKDFARARLAIDEALRLDPKNELYLNNRGWLEREVAASQ